MTELTLEEAFLLHQQGELKEAIQAYLEIETEDGEEKAKLYELTGIAHAQLNEIETALGYFKKALKIKPHYLSIQNNIATCYKKLGQDSKAVKLYLSILKHNPFQCVTMNNLASLYIQHEEVDKATYYLKKAITLQPQYADAYYNLGLIGNPECFKTASDLGHDKASYHYALNLEANEKLQESKHYYELSIKRNENHALSEHGLARVLLALGEDEEALSHFIHAQRIDPYIPHLMENIGAYYHVKGMHANAVEYWIKSLNNTDDKVDIWYNIGVAYQYLYRHEDALNYFNMVLESEPNHQKAHTNVAAIFLQSNQPKLAISHYGKVLQLDPDNEEVKYILSALKKESHNFDRSPKQYVSNLFDQYASHYDQHLTKMLKYQLPEKVELMLYEYFKPRSDKTILDLGCGTGLMGSKLRPFASSLVGIDLSANMLNRAKATCQYDQLLEEDCFTYLKNKKKFDIIIALELCPYIGDIEPLLKAIRHSLNPEGLFIFSIESTKDERFVLSEHARYEHNIDWVRTLLEEHNLKIKEEEPVILRTQNAKPVSGYLLVITPAS